MVWGRRGDHCGTVTLVHEFDLHDYNVTYDYEWRGKKLYVDLITVVHCLSQESISPAYHMEQRFIRGIKKQIRASLAPVAQAG